jgi:hypothetical protein
MLCGSLLITSPRSAGAHLHHLRYLIIYQSDRKKLEARDRWFGLRSFCPPNLRIIFEKRSSTKGDWPSFHNILPRYPAGIYIERPTTIATLSLILKYPLTWKVDDEDLASGPVTTISKLQVRHQAYATQGSFQDGNLSELLSARRIGSLSTATAFDGTLSKGNETAFAHWPRPWLS